MPRTTSRRARYGGAVVLLLAAANIAAPTAGAAPPVADVLNPPAPDFYACMTTGSGTVCHGQQRIVNEPAPTDITCGSGAGAFQVYDQGIELQVASRTYDTDGNLVRRSLHTRWIEAQWSNPLTGNVVPYTQTTIGVDELAVPGDFDTATHTDIGENIYRTSEGGRPVLMSVGRSVIGPGDELLEFSGKLWWIDLFFFGDTTVLDEVCAALS